MNYCQSSLIMVPLIEEPSLSRVVTSDVDTTEPTAAAHPRADDHQEPKKHQPQGNSFKRSFMKTRSMTVPKLPAYQSDTIFSSMSSVISEKRHRSCVSPCSSSSQSEESREIPLLSSMHAASTKPTEYDVLLGRGRPFIDHKGNIRMREIVEGYKERYEMAGKHEKTAITKEVVHMIKTVGVLKTARFLKQDPATLDWIEVSEKEAHMKVGHRLREDRFKLKPGTTETKSRSVAKKLGQKSRSTKTRAGGSTSTEPISSKAVLVSGC